MGYPSAAAVPLLILGLFTIFIPSTYAQPCENNGHGVLGSGKQIMSQSNRCIIINNPPSQTTCPPGSILENGVCVPTQGPCPPGSILQNGVCVPTTTQTPPVAVATALPSSTVSAGTTVTLIGSSSHATTSGATIASYQWTQTTEPFVTLSPSANTANPTFIAPFPAAGANTTTLTFSLTVTDSNGMQSQPSKVTIIVTPQTTN